MASSSSSRKSEHVDASGVDWNAKLTALDIEIKQWSDLLKSCIDDEKKAGRCEQQLAGLRAEKKQLLDIMKQPQGGAVPVVVELESAIVSKAVAIAASPVDGFMDVSRLIEALKLDAREFPSFLLVRQCYVDLLALMDAGWNGDIAQYIVLGTPGIGKSMFALYALIVLVERGETVVWELGDRRCFLSKGRVAVGKRSSASFEDVLHQKDVYYLVDTQGLELEPEVCHGKIAIFCSPNPVRYKDAKKRVATDYLYAPMWSEAELRSCRKKSFPSLSEELFDRVVFRFGGVPRFVLRDAAVRGEKVFDEVEKAFGRQTHIKLLLECVGESDVPDDKTSYKIVHIVPSDDYMHCHLEFASDYVKEELLSRYEDVVSSSLRDFLASSREPAEAQSLRGQMFEKWAHRFIARGGTFNLRRLTQKGRRSESTANWTFANGKPCRYVSLDSLGSDLQRKVYYVPTSRVQQSYDAFAVIGNRVVVFQQTIGLRHPAFRKAVSDLCYFVSTTLVIEAEVWFVFAVPSRIAAAFQTQSFLGASKQVLKNQPDWGQFVLTVDI